jgi:hypothetical protein
MNEWSLDLAIVYLIFLYFECVSWGFEGEARGKEKGKATKKKQVKTNDALFLLFFLWIDFGLVQGKNARS